MTNDIILAISRCDTLKPLGILFRPFANSVHDTKYHKRWTEVPSIEPHHERNVIELWETHERFEMDKIINMITNRGRKKKKKLLGYCRLEVYWCETE